MATVLLFLLLAASPNPAEPVGVWGGAPRGVGSVYFYKEEPHCAEGYDPDTGCTQKKAAVPGCHQPQHCPGCPPNKRVGNHETRRVNATCTEFYDGCGNHVIVGNVLANGNDCPARGRGGHCLKYMPDADYQVALDKYANCQAKQARGLCIACTPPKAYRFYNPSDFPYFP